MSSLTERIESLERKVNTLVDLLKGHIQSAEELREETPSSEKSKRYLRPEVER